MFDEVNWNICETDGTKQVQDLIIPLKLCLLNMRERTILIFHIVVMISDANLEVGKL